MSSEKAPKCAESVAIIGCADGPISVFIVDETKKLLLKARIKNSMYRYKRKRAAKKIVAGTHTLNEMAEYAVKNYGAIKSGNKSDEHPDNFHIYEIKSGDNYLTIEMDYNSNTFGVSFSGSKKEMKCFQKIVKDLYTYYGVSEDDIKNKTERYLSLLCQLSM